MKPIIVLAITLSLCLSANAQIQKNVVREKETSAAAKSALKTEIPRSLKIEHKELHEKLARYTKLPGKTGVAAKEVAKLLHPHFIKEETYALPPLGLLSDLATGQAGSNTKEAIDMAEQLKREFQEMLLEHKQIVTALQKLSLAARDERRPDVMLFTENIKLHAQTEEEVLYPAAILVGEYLKLKSQ